MLARVVCFLILALSCAGCQTTRPATGDASARAQQKDSPQEIKSAIKAVVSAVSGENVSEKELRGVIRDLKNDPDARSAIESISGSMEGRGIIMYCPVDGERFSAGVKICPTHHVLLKVVE